MRHHTELFAVSPRNLSRKMGEDLAGRWALNARDGARPFQARHLSGESSAPNYAFNVANGAQKGYS